MSEPPSKDAIVKPAMCPFCKGRIIETLAKIISPTALWRCRECEGTWTIAGLKASSTPSR